MKLIYRSVIVPLGLASLIAGIVSSLGTWWSLVRHYWVPVKRLFTIPAVILILLHIRPVDHFAGEAARDMLSSADFPRPQTQLVAYADAALVLLVAAVPFDIQTARGRTWSALERTHESLFAVNAGEPRRR